MTVKFHIVFFRVVIPCSLVDGHQHVREKYLPPPYSGYCFVILNFSLLKNWRNGNNFVLYNTTRYQDYGDMKQK
jgi:hypothetical protein